MKIRIKGNTLRLRLSQSEVTQMEESGQVSDQIDFGMSKLIYRMCETNEGQVDISFEKNIIEILVPQIIISQWLKKEEVGFSENLLLQNGNTLSLLVEKDFQCLTVREGEDESDLFQNPAQAHGH